MWLRDESSRRTYLLVATLASLAWGLGCGDTNTGIVNPVDGSSIDLVGGDAAQGDLSEPDVPVDVGVDTAEDVAVDATKDTDVPDLIEDIGGGVDIQEDIVELSCDELPFSAFCAIL